MNIVTRRLVYGGLASVLILLMCGVPSMAEAATAPEDPMVAETQAVHEETIQETQAAQLPSGSEEEHQESDDQDALPSSNEETQPEQMDLEIIEDEPVPLAGDLAPSVAIRANRDISNLRIGDELVLTAELHGFQGLECAIRWQACKDGQWQDLKGQDSTRLTIRITEENASWAYRVVVDAAPAL